MTDWRFKKIHLILITLVSRQMTETFLEIRTQLPEISLLLKVGWGWGFLKKGNICLKKLPKLT